MPICLMLTVCVLWAYEWGRTICFVCICHKIAAIVGILFNVRGCVCVSMSEWYNITIVLGHLTAYIALLAMFPSIRWRRIFGYNYNEKSMIQRFERVNAAFRLTSICLNWFDFNLKFCAVCSPSKSTNSEMKLNGKRNLITFNWYVNIIINCANDGNLWFLHVRY